MQVEEVVAKSHSTNVAADWDDAHRYTPPPRHRRRLLLRWLKKLQFNDCLDAGCAQGFLLHSIAERFGVAGHGCDVSDEVIARNRENLPGLTFEVLDLTRQAWPGDRQFDLVVCSEVLEHLADWRGAVANLARMTRKDLVITVPTGTIWTMDRMLGHLQHFAGPELCGELEANGLVVERVSRWGFPFHSLYKYLISSIAPAKMYGAYLSGKRYSLGQRMLANAIHALFYVNDLFPGGCQLMVHARPAR